MSIEIVEEKIRLSGVEFSKSEIIEISKCISLASDGLSFVLNTSGDMPKKIRASSPMQRALIAGLFEIPDGKFRPKSELIQALLRYRT